MAGAALRLKMAFSSTSPSITLGARAPCAAAAAMWARVPKNVKKPQGENQNVIWGLSNMFDFVNFVFFHPGIH